MKTNPKHEDKRVAFEQACDMLAKAVDEAHERARADFLIRQGVSITEELIHGRE